MSINKGTVMKNIKKIAQETMKVAIVVGLFGLAPVISMADTNTPQVTNGGQTQLAYHYRDGHRHYYNHRYYRHNYNATRCQRVCFWRNGFRHCPLRCWR